MLHSLLHFIKHLACIADIGRAAGVNGVLNICIVAQDCDVRVSSVSPDPSKVQVQAGDI